ncbi:tetraacyldisaccharide 4'-kinase [Colwellia sp. Bg11-12]|jgi:tetraacyldisaccharide 4'-kinase|uniref:tetraacyldisaccharide 4'-kinase n=1 Tax=Colwellia sp. Bg11-12 TaxID=2759817 RepID=UPI0015F4C108|nr:tetraacyldisaccharide 4'-kinase [Colwellia sp. Bg11-12]MBA6263162.1 tetraacyldisaccharide 4'-kinase [Colwellia sp. Bg11-12]
MRLIEKVWFFQHPAKWFLVPILLPLTVIFWLLSAVRRKCYLLDFFKSFAIDIPVVVVGNIGIGGNGKTPVVLYLIEQCLAQGIKVGVISRGYGGKAPHYPYLLSESSTAAEAGDEPLLIYQRHGIPVVVGGDRVLNAQLLVKHGCEVIIADDGLQHYRLKRDFELIVIDSKREFGNGFLLPSGPLREGLWRLKTVDALIFNGATPPEENSIYPKNTPQIIMTLMAKTVVNVKTKQRLLLTEFQQTFTERDNKCINAIAGIGDPARFFKTLVDVGFSIDKSVGFVDHQHYNKMQFSSFSDDIPLLMTEKDAVKCTDFAQDNWWYLPVDAQIEKKQITPFLDGLFDQVKANKLSRIKARLKLN